MSFALLAKAAEIAEQKSVNRVVAHAFAFQLADDTLVFVTKVGVFGNSAHVLLRRGSRV